MRDFRQVFFVKGECTPRVHRTTSFPSDHELTFALFCNGRDVELEAMTFGESVADIEEFLGMSGITREQANVISKGKCTDEGGRVWET